MPITDFDHPYCPPYASIYPALGIGCALALTGIGSAYGTYRSAIGLFKVCTSKPELLYKSLMPIIMAGIVGIYGLVTAIIISTNIKDNEALFIVDAYKSFAAGLTVGIAGLSSGFAIGVAGERSIVAMAAHSELLMGTMLILIFGEVIGLYGFIISIIIATTKTKDACSKLPDTFSYL